MPSIELINDDCMNVMRGYPDKYFDLACVDPPYGIGEDGVSNHSRDKLAIATRYISKSWDKTPPEAMYFLELQRVSKNQIIWGANHFADRLPCPASPCWIVWDKENGDSDFADCELAYASFKTAVRKFNFKWSGMLQGDMKNKEQRIHPTQKPVKLYQWLLENYAKPGQRILDTHLGSGSSAIAAHYFGVDFVGCELDADYFASAKERFKQATAQVSMFEVCE
jgi:site-specific DNA-methyltransferase (adenine-specific)